MDIGGKYKIDAPNGGTILPASGGIVEIINLVTGVIQILVVVAITSSFIFLLIGGIKWIMSGGDKQALAGAKAAVTYAIIGLVLALLSFAILQFFLSFFGFNPNDTSTTGQLHQIPGYN